MRHSIMMPVGLIALVALSACEQSGEAQVERALQDLNVVDETNLNDVMLTVAEAVSWRTRRDSRIVIARTNIMALQQSRLY